MITSVTLSDFQFRNNQWIEENPFKSYQSWMVDQGASARRYLDQTPNELRLKCFALAFGTPIIVTIALIVEAIFKAIKIVTFANFWMIRETPKQVQGTLCHQLYFNREDRPLCLVDFNPFVSAIEGTGPKETMVYFKAKIKALPKKTIFSKNPMKQSYQFKARVWDTANDLSFFLKAIPTLVGRELCAIYGTVISPRDGAKVFAGFERWQNGSFYIAPCFQPEAKFHGLGGDISNPDSW